MGLNTLQVGQGWELHHLEQPQPEALATLAAMAGATQRINLLSGIVIAPLRPAGLLAKTAATLHALSRGRFVMGVTTSWQKDEYDALGVPHDQRGQILDDNIGACRALWAGAPASFHSPTVNFDGMFCSPRPAPGERIRVWFGGKFTPRQVRRVVSLGDGWMPYGGLRMTVEQKLRCNLIKFCGGDPERPVSLFQAKRRRARLGGFERKGTTRNVADPQRPHELEAGCIFRLLACHSRSCGFLDFCPTIGK